MQTLVKILSVAACALIANACFDSARKRVDGSAQSVIEVGLGVLFAAAAIFNAIS